MTGHPTLTGRLIGRTLAATSALLVALALVVTIWIDPPERPVQIWYWPLHNLVKQSLARDANGALRLSPVPELARMLAENPALEIAAMTSPGGEVALGSHPALLADLRRLKPLEVEQIIFNATRADGIVREGGGRTDATPFGDVTIYVLGGTVRRADVLYIARQVATDIARYAVPTLALLALVVWSVLRSALAPLQEAGRQTARTDFGRPAARLPEDRRVPRELLPLVQGVNRALDSLEAGFARQQRFTANAAHEMRTPLGILRARIDSLDDAPTQGALRRDAQRITTMVDQMLAVARLEQNEDAMARFDLGALAADLIADFVPLALDTDRLIAFVPPPAPVHVHGAMRAIASAVGNLIDNALHAEPEGGTVIVTVTQDGAVVVSDHGPGVAPEEQNLVFEPFWRRDESREGTGLGLAIVREIATLHGGTVSVSQTPGGGATFRLSLVPVE